ncbi:hypothetical protein BU26DRAFT_517865 [Trematosphaeria pertusa]|uniref:CENP-V/GFA domain-containing protein n=1 Tax=Trematosphaeria pertusa TaxID=390896 RepID=A0A6A6IKK3_9PLEO|nr:uncharacterized protein BU26DRAFT_517865 [Trematosphaeria pertusa]KAF2251145.1 hypothetical protein BU26DRAFT_517865 [Trematosphaeria pertusa]
MSKSRPFPAVTGGCFCGLVRYRLETAPLFCHACHCADCHKSSGSVFACFATIEADRVTSIGSMPPKFATTVRRDGVARHNAFCPKCGTQLWGNGDWSPATIDIRVGSLDIPGLMEPDLHEFIESKVDWVILPEGAKTCKGGYEIKDYWPKSSLKRLDAAMSRYEERLKLSKAAASGAGEDEDEKEADKTPTAQSPEEKEDDEEFEKRYQVTEKALQERLEKLSLKLNEQEVA